jgi:WD40 repeat protein
MSFDKASSILATRDDSTPTTVWLWDLVKLTPLAVMIQHSPVRQLSWRLQDPELLLIKCSQDDSTAYVWDTRTMTPEAIAVPFPKTTGRIDYRWITGSPGRGAQMLVNDKQGFATFRLLDTASQTENCEQNDDDVDASMDSVYEALVGRSASRGHDEVDLLESQDDVTEAMDDTFVGIRKYPLSSR